VNLARSALKGMMWAYAAFFGGRLITLLTTAVLARLLIPEDFGVIAFALLVLNFIESTRSFGINDALIYNTDGEDDAADTAFLINAFIGLAQFVVVFLLAPLAVRFVTNPEIVTVVRWMGLAFIFNGLGQTHDALMQKNLSFKRRFFPDLISAVIKGVMSIGAALLGFGLWSLVIGHVVGSVVRMIAAWLVLRWRPRFRFYMKKARDLWHYGMHILMLNILSIAMEQADPLMVGLLLGELQLGYYTVAAKIPEMIILNIGIVMTRVIFPTYVKIKDDRELLVKSMLVTLKYTAFVVVAIGLGLAATAPEMMRLVYGWKWEPAIPLMQVLPLLGMTSMLAWNAGDVFKAIGRPDISTKLLVIETAYTFGLIWLFVAPSHLAIMVALANLLAYAISAVLRLGLISHYLKFNPRQYFRVYRGAFVAGAAMYGAVTLWRNLLAGQANLLILLSSIAVGGIVYIAILYLLERDDIKQASKTVLSVFQRRGSANETGTPAPAGPAEIYAATSVGRGD
jgi:O-antigen/teichoic acid export membrane protein